jgi:glutaredoxin 3
MVMSTKPPMQIVTIYTLPNCEFCELAKNLLHSKQNCVIYEIDLSKNSKVREGVKETLGTTVPQIVIDGKHIGGYSELQGYI